MSTGKIVLDKIGRQVKTGLSLVKVYKDLR